MTDRPPEPRKPWNLDAIAIALISVGALVFMLCGSCTGYFVGPAIWSMITHPSGGAGGGGEAGLAAVILVVTGVIGGLPTLGGLVLLMVGVNRARRGKPKPPPSSAPPPR